MYKLDSLLNARRLVLYTFFHEVLFQHILVNRDLDLWTIDPKMWRIHLIMRSWCKFGCTHQLAFHTDITTLLNSRNFQELLRQNCRVIQTQKHVFKACNSPRGSRPQKSLQKCEMKYLLPESSSSSWLHHFSYCMLLQNFDAVGWVFWPVKPTTESENRLQPDSLSTSVNIDRLTMVDNTSAVGNDSRPWVVPQSIKWLSTITRERWISPDSESGGIPHLFGTSLSPRIGSAWRARHDNNNNKLLHVLL